MTQPPRHAGTRRLRLTHDYASSAPPMNTKDVFLVYFERLRWHAVQATPGGTIADGILGMPLVVWIQASDADSAAITARLRHSHIKRIKIAPGAAPSASSLNGRIAAKVACGICWSVMVANPNYECPVCWSLSIVNSVPGLGSLKDVIPAAEPDLLKSIANCNGFNECADGVWLCTSCIELIESIAIERMNACIDDVITTIQRSMLPRKDTST